MRALLFVALTVASIACGGGGKQTAPANKPTGAAPAAATDDKPCTEEVALSCPDGQVDACAELKAADKAIDSNEPGSGTAMALSEGKMSSAKHHCVAKK